MIFTLVASAGLVVFAHLVNRRITRLAGVVADQAKLGARQVELMALLRQAQAQRILELQAKVERLQESLENFLDIEANP